MKILIFSLFVLFVVSEWSMKQNNLQRTGLEEGVEGPDIALNVSSRLRITFEEIEKKCPANEGQKFYWHGPLVYSGRNSGDGNDLLIVAFGPCVIAMGYDAGYSVFYKVWDSRVSHFVNGKNEMCHFWGDLQIDKFKKITHGICRNPVNNISYLFSFTITYQSIVMVKSEEIAIPLGTALYQPKGDWVVDKLGNFFLISTQLQKSHLPGLYAKLSNGKTWSITVGEKPLRVSLPNSNYFFSGPIIFNDNTKLVYSFGDNKTFSTAYYIDIESGNITWKVSFSASSYPTGGIGVSSDDSILYFSQYGSTVALSRSDGNEIWKLNEIKYGSLASLQYISPSNMLLGMDSGDCCGGGRIVCINPRSGDVMWATNFLGLKGYEGYIGGYGATVDKNHNIYLGLSNYGIVTLSPYGDVLFNYQNRDSKMSVAYSFQPLLMNTKAGMLFVVLWAGDSIPGKIRSNFITSFQYVNGLTNNTNYPSKYTTTFIIELLAMVGILLLLIVILLSYLRNGYDYIRTLTNTNVATTNERYKLKKLVSRIIHGQDEDYDNLTIKEPFSSFNSDSFSIGEGDEDEDVDNNVANNDFKDSFSNMYM